ncbi:MAG: hypothetical protein F6K30_18980 [Cyanothece sp. SIO2G6]|nr:hypothetical protein [Cyanothece sp. SIO2G6]
MARIRRTDTNLVPNPQAIEQAATTVQPVPGREAIAWLHNQFGLESQHFNPYTLWSTGKEKEWLASCSCNPPANVVPHTIGLPLVRRTPHGFKPTTAALQRFGRHITQ